MVVKNWCLRCKEGFDVPHHPKCQNKEKSSEIKECFLPPHEERDPEKDDDESKYNDCGSL